MWVPTKFSVIIVVKKNTVVFRCTYQMTVNEPEIAHVIPHYHDTMAILFSDISE